MSLVRGKEKKTNAHGFENDERGRDRKRIFTLVKRKLRLVGKKVKKNVVEQGGENRLLQTRMIGSYNVSNLLGVLAAMRALGVPLDAAVQAPSRASLQCHPPKSTTSRPRLPYRPFVRSTRAHVRVCVFFSIISFNLSSAHCFLNAACSTRLLNFLNASPRGVPTLCSALKTLP